MRLNQEGGLPGKRKAGGPRQSLEIALRTKKTEAVTDSGIYSAGSKTSGLPCQNH
jgi:hypothetical protein